MPDILFVHLFICSCDVHPSLLGGNLVLTEADDCEFAEPLFKNSK